LREWAAIWSEARAALDAVKRAELERLDTIEALRQLADAFEAALRAAPPRSTSGLIEQQRVLQRLRG
jgi:hypothetical protein